MDLRNPPSLTEDSCLSSITAQTAHCCLREFQLDCIITLTNLENKLLLLHSSSFELYSWLIKDYSHDLAVNIALNLFIETISRDASAPAPPPSWGTIIPSSADRREVGGLWEWGGPNNRPLPRNHGNKVPQDPLKMSPRRMAHMRWGAEAKLFA